MAKIIKIDAFDRCTVSDILVEENLDEIFANEKVNILNEALHEQSFIYYKAVKDDYVLFDHTDLY